MLTQFNNDSYKQYVHNSELGYYSINETVIKEDGAEPILQFISQFGAGTGDGSDRPFGARLYEDIGRGLQIFNNNNKLGMTFIPQFEADRGGVDEDGYFVFPLRDVPGNLVYTPVSNGFKEDIVLEELSGDEQRFEYKLELGEFLEARVNEDGSVGVYSGDLSLFDETTFGSDKDLDAIIERRRNAVKNTLVFGIPIPYVIQSGDSPADHSAKVRFELDGDMLAVIAEDLANLNYPISIDPTLVVTTDADFLQGSGDGFIDFPTNQVSRQASTGAKPNWIATTDMVNSRRMAGNAVAYNGFLYTIGGSSNGTNYQSDVQRAPINTNGTTGVWATQAGDAISTARNRHAVVEYNGFMYVIGGEVSGGSASTSIEYAQIASNGSIGTWNTDTLSGARREHAAVAYNGYMYIIGGDSGSRLATVHKAPIFPDGSLGTWDTSLPSISIATEKLGAIINGNRIYIVGGFDGDETEVVQYAILDELGDVEGAWVTTEPLPEAQDRHMVISAGGYIYSISGVDATATRHAKTFYAPLNADGSISDWREIEDVVNQREYGMAAVYKGTLYTTGGVNSVAERTTDYGIISDPGPTSKVTTTTSLPAQRQQFTSAVHNGYVYVAGGPGTSKWKKVTHAPLNSDGTIGSWTVANSLANGRALSCGLVLNDYLYVIGGWQTSANDYSEHVEYSAVASDGTLGTWSTTTTIPAYNGNAPSNGRRGAACFAHNGRIYIMGGDYQNTVGGGSNRSNRTYYATPASDGTISSWTTNASNLPTSAPRLEGQLVITVVYNGVIYRQPINNANEDEIWYNDIASDGSFDGTWTKATGELVQIRDQVSFAVWNGFLYVVGGWNGSSTYYKNVEFGKIENDGDISSFTRTEDLSSVGIRGQGTIIHRGHMVTLGGYTGSATLTTVQTSAVNVSGQGTVDAWATSTALPTATTEHCSVTVNDFIYVIGGDTGSSVATVRNAPINPDGTVGTWATTTSIPAAREGLACTTYNGRIYITGGANGATEVSDIYYAEPSSITGLVSSWITETNEFTTARRDHSTVAWDGYLYVLGGDTGVTELSDVQFTAIAADGSLGSWSSTTSFTTARKLHATVAFGGYLYLIAGNDGTATRLNDVQYAQLSGTGTITGGWNDTTTLIDRFEGMSAVAANGYLYIFGGYDGTTVDNRVWTVPISENGNLEVWDRTEDLGTARHRHATVYHDGFFITTGGATNGAGSTRTAVTEYAGQQAISKKGTYSKLIDLGNAFRLTTVIYNGTILAGSEINLSFKSACTSTDAFVDQVSYDNLAEGTDKSISALGRYLLMQLEIDDSRAIGFHDAQSVIDDITFTYAYGWTEPDTRLRVGNFFQDQTEQPYDTLDEIAGGVISCQ